MKRLFLYSITGLLSVTIPIIIMAQDPRAAAASQGLAKYKKIILLAPEKERLINASDTGNLAVGQPLQTAVISLDALKAYRPGQPADQLITNTDEYIYPVINNQNKRISGTMTIVRKGDRWSAARYGADRQALVDAGEFMASAAGANTYRLVKMLAFHLNFLSYTEASTLMFVPLQEDPERGIPKGRPATAASVLEKYIQAANSYNGLPM